MKANRFVWSGLAMLFLAALALPSQALADDDDDDDDDFGVRIAPIFSSPGGQTYGRWAAEWWQWALGVPAANNPLTDETGEYCDQRQVDDTWFLAGIIFGESVVRDCTVPEGKALFFPVINTSFGAFLTDPPEQRTEAFLREQAVCKDLVGYAEIDGVRIGARRLRRLTTGASGSQSPLFDIQLPLDNIFGVGEDVIPELILSPTAEQGFYIYLKPLSPGAHRIHWEVRAECPPGDEPRGQQITYYLTIVEEDHDGADDDDDDD